MAEPKVGTREEWLTARRELLAREKELIRQGEELAGQRQELPWVPVEKEYRFETGEGTKTLAELFDGRSQLLVYIDFGVSFTEEQRSQGADAEYNFEPVDFAAVIEDFAGSDSMAEAAASCGTDLEGYVTTEGPGLSAFALSDGVVHHTYSCYAPEADFMVFYNQLLDRAPKGRKDDVQTRRHDEYEDASR